MHVQCQHTVGDRFVKLGTEEEKQEILAPICAGKKVGCFGFTEPDTGSNPKMLKTVAKEVKDGYIINGVKRFITNAPWADVMCVFAKLEGDISLFFVETDRKGFSTGPKMDKLGLRGTALSDVFFEDVHVPKDHLLGAKGGKL